MKRGVKPPTTKRSEAASGHNKFDVTYINTLQSWRTVKAHVPSKLTSCEMILFCEWVSLFCSPIWVVNSPVLMFSSECAMCFVERADHSARVVGLLWYHYIATANCFPRDRMEFWGRGSFLGGSRLFMSHTPFERLFSWSLIPSKRVTRIPLESKCICNISLVFLAYVGLETVDSHMARVNLPRDSLNGWERAEKLVVECFC